MRLGDALRSLDDPAAIQTAAARVLGEHLGATRAMYAEVDGDPGAEVGTIRGRYLASGGTLSGPGAPFPERYAYDTFGERVMALRRRGEPMVVADVTTDPAFDDAERAAWAAGDVRAAVTVPLVKGGRFVADFGVHSAGPRAWTADEVALVEETAERTWSAVELVRVQRRAAEANALLVRFADAARGHTEPEAIAEIASRLVADALGVERAYWAEVDWATREYVVGAAFHAPGVPVVAGRFPVDAWEPFTALHLAGRPVVVDDTQADPRLSPEMRSGYRQMRIGADLATPVATGGRLRCVLAVNQRLPRHWGQDEVALVQRVADRCWAEVERARVEAALRASEEQFRRSIEEAPIPVVMHAEDGAVLQVSRTWTELTGYTASDVPTFDAWLTRAYGEGADAVRAHVRALFAGDRRTMSVDFPVRTRSGDLRHWSFSASAPGALHDGRRFVVGMALDVTERRRAEEALRASEARYRTLVEHVPDYAIFLLDAAGTVIEWPAGAERVTGYPAAEAVGQPLARFYAPEEAAAGLPAAHLAEAAAAGRGEWEGWRVRRDGTRFWANEIATAVRDADADGAPGRLVGFTKITRDLTGRRLAEAAAEERRLAAARDELRRALAAAEEGERRRLARELHDQLGQHLTGFTLALGDLRRRLAAGDPVEPRVQALEDLARLMTRDARTLALELRPPELDDVGLASALATYVRDWGGRAGVAADVAVLGRADDAVPGDVGTAVYRIAQEALTNVAKHAGATQVSVILERVEGARADGDGRPPEVRLLVEDDGRGFDADADAARVRDERRLGLAGIRERAALVGGTVILESSPGAGTTLQIRIPIREAGPEARAAAGTTAMDG